jgi:Domain of unknown function (DUF5710)
MTEPVGGTTRPHTHDQDQQGTARANQGLDHAPSALDEIRGWNITRWRYGRHSPNVRVRAYPDVMAGLLGKVARPWLVSGRSLPAEQTAAGPGRLWLDVPFAEKDEAKQLGARWDPAQRRWYAPRPGMAGLARWAPRPPLPDLLPGEDRSFGSGLFVDLVPQSCWFTNVRSGVAPADWDRVRRMVYRRAGDRCEACGRARDQAAGVRMEAHERWYFDDARGVQVLRRLICLCGSCHGTTHFGLANVQGRAAEALGHLIAVTGTSRELAEARVDEAFDVWQHRSARTWDLDLSILTAAGVALARPVSPAHRAEVARDRLAAERRR